MLLRFLLGVFVVGRTVVVCWRTIIFRGGTPLLVYIRILIVGKPTVEFLWVWDPKGKPVVAHITLVGVAFGTNDEEVMETGVVLVKNGDVSEREEENGVDGVNIVVGVVDTVTAGELGGGGGNEAKVGYWGWHEGHVIYCIIGFTWLDWGIVGKVNGLLGLFDRPVFWVLEKVAILDNSVEGDGGNELEGINSFGKGDDETMFVKSEVPCNVDWSNGGKVVWNELDKIGFAVDVANTTIGLTDENVSGCVVKRSCRDFGE